MKLSVVIPAQNEEGSVGGTVGGVVARIIEREGIDYEVRRRQRRQRRRLDRSRRRRDGERNPRVHIHRSHLERGFGNAIRAGLEVFQGDAVAIVMADASDNPEDLVMYQRVLEQG